MLKDSENILKMYKTMISQNIICAYHGQFSYEVVNALLKDAKKDLSSLDINRRTAKRTYNVLVECLENIHKHASEYKTDENIPNDGIFVLSNKKESYFVTVGNLMYEKEVPALKKKLEEVNSLERDGLKQKYREIIKSGSISDKGGAGLGIIDIALKSKNQLEYKFHPYAEGITFFILKVTINNV